METTTDTDFFSQDVNFTKRRDGCIFGGKADIPKTFNFHDSNHSNVFMPSSVGVSNVPSIRRVDKNDMKDKEMAAIQTSPFIIPPDSLKTLMEDLYMARLCFLRARNISMNQLKVYEEEAIKHMKEIRHITEEEFGNPEASAELLTKELVKVGSEVIRNQQALNRIEMEELEKNVDSLLNVLRSDVKEAKSLAELESKEESGQRSYYRDLIFDHGHLGFFIPIILLVLCIQYSLL